MNLLKSAVISLVVIAVVLVVGLNILENLQATQTPDGYAYNATTTTITAVSDIPDWLPIIVLVIVAVVLFGYLAYFSKSAQ